ncbi:hypothetical protein C8R47DRAFT_1324212 [Mycena vitilis]|nr:hypothetical protein C8R47DRAFT_1324212 [Mycena vitilis]
MADYTDAHTSAVICFAFSDGGRCTSGPAAYGFRGFCCDHQGQAMWLHTTVSTAQRRAHGEERRCCGLTKTGMLCRKNTRGKFMFCFLHGSQHVAGLGPAPGAPEPREAAVIRARCREFDGIQADFEVELQTRRARERQREERDRAERERQRQQEERFWQEQQSEEQEFSWRELSEGSPQWELGLYVQQNPHWVLETDERGEENLEPEQGQHEDRPAEGSDLPVLDYQRSEEDFGEDDIVGSRESLLFGRLKALARVAMLLLRGLIALWAAFAGPRDRMTATSNSVRVAQDFSCSICLSTYVSPVITMCMHIFCESCIQDLQRPACPLCQAPLVEECIRDALFEQELAEAIESGLAPPPE